MFNKTLISFLLIISFSVTAQKKELKAVNKLVESQDYNTALEQLLSIESVIESSEIKYQALYQFLAGKIYGFLKDFESSFSAFNEAKKLELDNGSSKFTIEINRLLQKFSIDAINKAVEEQNNNNFTESADLLILVYNLDKENNVEYLYFASSMELQADNYDNALIYLNQLRDLNYTGSVEKYYTTDNETGEEIELPFEQYNLLQKSKKYSNFRTEMTKSRLPEIVRNIAFIYVQQKRNDLAIEALKDARSVSPLDVDLILAEANLYMELGEVDKYTNLVKMAIERDPQNHLLFYNLGIVSKNKGDLINAKLYVDKSIEINPNYADSYSLLNSLIVIRLQEIQNKMDKLGFSKSDTVKYNNLEKQKLDIIKNELIPSSHKVLSFDSEDIYAINNLIYAYSNLGDNTNQKKYQNLRDSLKTGS
jgi:tetratricopeptide (TPR) repeat protein